MINHNTGSNITMKKSQFLKEHKKLIHLLNVGKNMVAEAVEQQKEVQKYLKNGRKKKVSNK